MLLLLEVATLGILAAILSRDGALESASTTAAETAARVQFFLFFLWLAVLASFILFWAFAVSYSSWLSADLSLSRLETPYL
jgi:hypothetical protein